MKKIIFSAVLVAFGIVSCKKETSNQNNNQNNSSNTKVSGSEWVKADASFTKYIQDLATFNNTLYLSYIYYNGNFIYSGKYENNAVTHYIDNSLGGGSGFDKLKVHNGQLYGIGMVGSTGVWSFQGENNGQHWAYCTSASVGNTSYNVNDFLWFNEKKVVGISFSPYILSDNVALGSGMNGNVYCLVEFNGELYAGGSFTTAGGTTAKGVAKWNGTSWSAVGDGFTGTVWDLEVYNGKLYAAGSFSKSGNNTVNNVAYWDGTKWAAMETGLVGGYNGVRNLLSYGNQLFVAGDFTGSATVNSPYVIEWNGSSWLSLPGTVPDIAGPMAVCNGSLYVANQFNSSSNYFLKLN